MELRASKAEKVEDERNDQKDEESGDSNISKKTLKLGDPVESSAESEELETPKRVGFGAELPNFGGDDSSEGF